MRHQILRLRGGVVKFESPEESWRKDQMMKCEQMCKLKCAVEKIMDKSGVAATGAVAPLLLRRVELYKYL